jgi:hypothetical protein
LLLDTHPLSFERVDLRLELHGAGHIESDHGGEPQVLELLSLAGDLLEARAAILGRSGGLWRAGRLGGIAGRRGGKGASNPVGQPSMIGEALAQRLAVRLQRGLRLTLGGARRDDQGGAQRNG